MESDSSDAFSWASLVNKGPWKFQYFHDGIRSLASQLPVVPRQVSRSTNEVTDSPSKQGVDRVDPFVGLLLELLFLLGPF